MYNFVVSANNNGFNSDLAAICRSKICWLKEIPRFNYIISQRGQAG